MDPSRQPSPAREVRVREALTPAEREAAGRVTQAAYAEFAPGFAPDDWAYYARTLPETRTRVEQGTLLIALERGDDVVGTVTLYLEPRPTSGHWRPQDAVFRFLAVRPDRRRRGVGTTLFRECVARTRAAGKQRLALQTTPNMAVARGMYERAGFRRDPDGDLVVGSFSLLGYALDLTGRAGAAPPPPARDRPGDPRA